VLRRRGAIDGKVGGNFRARDKIVAEIMRGLQWPLPLFPEPPMRPSQAQAFLLMLAACAAPLPAVAQADKAAKPAESAQADSGEYWRVIASPYTIHYGYDPEHEPVYMIGLERQRRDGWVWGGTYFSNSFGQPSGYAYVGEKVLNFTPVDKLFYQWTAGILYGYKEPYEDKVPFNFKGFSPGVTVGLGWQFTREISVQAIALGTAGLMFQLAIDLR
jgi:hypothetical protein